MIISNYAKNIVESESYMNKKISVIVPVCNVEMYLEDCIKSIINQTIGFENLELIMVDDGSTDSSYEIMEKYQKLYNNIKIYRFDTKSGSAGRPRNKGIEMAKGKYLMFSDPDDLFLPNSCEVMLNEIENKKADYVIGNYQNCYEDGTLWEKPVFSKEKYKNFKLNIKDYKNSFFIMNSSVCNKIFNSSFIKKIGVKFVEGIPAEDAVFSTYCFMKAKSVYYISDIMYLYRQRSENESTSTSCSYKFFDGINKAYRIIYDNFKENNEIGFYRYFYAKSMTYILYKFIDSNLLYEEEKIDILSNMRWFYKLSKELNVPACQSSLELIITKIIDGDYHDVIDICRVIREIRTFMPREIKETMSKPQPELYSKLEENYEEVVV